MRSDRYRHLLREVSISGDFDSWVRFFCEALTAQAQDAESRIRDLSKWRDRSLAMLRGKRVKGVALAVTEKLIEFPSLTVKHVAEAHGVSIQAANSAVARLSELRHPRGDHRAVRTTASSKHLPSSTSCSVRRPLRATNDAQLRSKNSC